jgi:hypothetical protein
MSNAFVDIVAEAAAEGWCLRPFCSTCGAKDFRLSLHRLRDVGFRNTLAALSPEQLTTIVGWRGALEIALLELPIRDVELLLETWVPLAGQAADFDDVVLFRIAKHLPPSSPARNQWIETIVQQALMNRYFSLIESLLLVLKRDALQHPRLIAASVEMARDSAQMRRVLRNVCQIATP